MAKEQRMVLRKQTSRSQFQIAIFKKKKKKAITFPALMYDSRKYGEKQTKILLTHQEEG